MNKLRILVVDSPSLNAHSLRSYIESGLEKLEEEASNMIHSSWNMFGSLPWDPPETDVYFLNSLYFTELGNPSWGTSRVTIRSRPLNDTFEDAGIVRIRSPTVIPIVATTLI